MPPAAPDAVVVGAGPNGLAAAVTLAAAGRSVVVYEAAATPGGGCRSAELTLPGFVHDVCASVHPLGAASPFLRSLPLADHGLEWAHPEIPLAHPLDDGSAAVLHRSLDATAAGLGADGAAWRRLVGPLLQRWEPLLDGLLGPLLPPRAPFAMARFLPGARSARAVAEHRFEGEAARALLAGCAAHACLPLSHPFTAGLGLVLAVTGHAVGWPVARGGSQRIIDALVAHLATLGGEVVCGHEVRSLDDLPPARATLFDLTPRQLARIAGDRMPARARRRLERYRYGPGVFKLDYALSGPVPWTAGACRRAATIHLGGTLAEIGHAEAEVTAGRHPERPYVLAAQQVVADPSRAPAGHHTLWAYCHVPNGSTVDMTEPVERQLDRFAPGWRDLVLARRATTPADLEAYNANDVGGDIAGGGLDGLQAVVRPAPRLDPYRTALAGVYLCSSSTPPGAGVHGRCGWFAARAALRHELR